jgi:hypothetical protein
VGAATGCTTPAAVLISLVVVVLGTLQVSLCCALPLSWVLLLPQATAAAAAAWHSSSTCCSLQQQLVIATCTLKGAWRGTTIAPPLLL